MPKLFRLTKGGKLNDGIFEGATINTPSMLATEDCLDALSWVENIGGLKTTIARSKENYTAIENWVQRSEWAAFLVEDPKMRSRTSICLSVKDPWFKDVEDQKGFIKNVLKLLEEEDAAYDIAGYRDAPAGFRIWGGATVNAGDLELLMPWLDWAYQTAKESEIRKKAA